MAAAVVARPVWRLPRRKRAIVVSPVAGSGSVQLVASSSTAAWTATSSASGLAASGIELVANVTQNDAFPPAAGDRFTVSVLNLQNAVIKLVGS